jgi:hypothetical protein
LIDAGLPNAQGSRDVKHVDIAVPPQLKAAKLSDERKELHPPKGRRKRAYYGDDLLDDRRQMMEAWDNNPIGDAHLAIDSAGHPRFGDNRTSTCCGSGALECARWGLSRPLRCELQACRKQQLRVRYRSTATSVNVCELRQHRRGLSHGYRRPRAPAIDRMGAAKLHVAHAIGKAPLSSLGVNRAASDACGRFQPPNKTD